MAIETETATGLEFCELSHPFAHGVPVWPGDDDVLIWKSVYHARDGVLSQKFRMNMHCSTHMTAPIHLVQGGAFVSQLPIDLFFGSGVVLDIPKAKWEYVTAADLEAVSDMVEDNDIVLINTGWHRKYSDSLEYFGDAPGLSEDAADWLIEQGIGEERALRLVAGEVIAAQVYWPGRLAAGQIEDAVLIARRAGSRRGTLRFASGEEALVDGLPSSASEGRSVR